MSGPRNRYGVNDAYDCYRTINGERYIAWLSCPSADRIAAYRAAGVRCRRQYDELFVSEDDQDTAASVDAMAEGRAAIRATDDAGES